MTFVFGAIVSLVGEKKLSPTLTFLVVAADEVAGTTAAANAAMIVADRAMRRVIGAPVRRGEREPARRTRRRAGPRSVGYQSDVVLFLPLYAVQGLKPGLAL